MAHPFLSQLDSPWLLVLARATEHLVLLQNTHDSCPSLEKCDAGTKGRGTGGVFTLPVQAPFKKQVIFLLEDPGLCAFL